MIFVPNKIFKTLLPIGTLLDTTILSMLTSYIEIGFSWLWNLCFSISVLPELWFLYLITFYLFILIIMSVHSNQCFVVNLQPLFYQVIKNTMMIKTFNVENSNIINVNIHHYYIIAHIADVLLRLKTYFLKLSKKHQ